MVNIDFYARLAGRRQRTAQLTPSGSAQPPEVRDVLADPRVPNVLQPESGEMHQGGEVDQGRPAFWPRRSDAASGDAHLAGLGDDIPAAAGAPLPTAASASDDGDANAADLSGIGDLLAQARAIRLPRAQPSRGSRR